MPVAIVGGRGCGKSVFTSLLASTAISYSVESKCHFRYYTDPVFTEAIGGIITSLKMKSWPPANLKGTLSEYNFYFGYSSLLSRFYMKGVETISLGKLSPPKTEVFDIVQFSLYDVAGEDVELIKQIATVARERGTFMLDQLSSGLRTILDCDVLVFLIDASKITTEANDPKYREMLEYDVLMAQLMSLVAMYRSKKLGVSTKKLYPVFVLTKSDTIDPKVLRSVGIPENYTKWLEAVSQSPEGRKEKNQKATELMRKFFQNTLALILGGAIMGVELERGQSFLSYIGTELNEEGISTPRLVSADRVAYELDYSLSEYKDFIKYFGTVARKIRDKKEEPGRYVVGLGK